MTNVFTKVVDLLNTAMPGTAGHPEAVEANDRIIENPNLIYPG